MLRRGDCDLAEAALLCCVEVEPDLDVDAELLRLDALADRLVTSGFAPRDARHDADALGDFLAGQLGFGGDHATYHDPSNALLTRVLDRRRGLPITLSIVYIAIGRRAGIRAYGIDMPGHFLVGVAHSPRGDEPPVVIDPFHDGAIISQEQVSARLRDAIGGRLASPRALLRPASAPAVVRRLLNNLTRDFLAQGDVEDALWTIELKRLLPGSGGHDVRVAAELLIQLGRYREAAATVENHLRGAPASEDADDLAQLALRARARMN